ncbi:hypothetical protein BDK51DRAFT_26699 [Blyttiomyces helicus]|uniref:PAS domain-containing protein n=1 Tax=Blyttiomyces helicus TaxID=388810 RepID=A0A4P9W4L2_9FUNG|nr:hypothetical protein BDK51DRAFT_26699 [Blyttiomyces helicus]|eukprot:RKO86195.1 hypothetical protein BDK51DRAFT_26699 [Blyttiomyces helicus]
MPALASSQRSPKLPTPDRESSTSDIATNSGLRQELARFRLSDATAPSPSAPFPPSADLVQWPSSVARFPAESLHSFSFSPSATSSAEAKSFSTRRSVIKRSVELIRSLFAHGRAASALTDAHAPPPSVKTADIGPRPIAVHALRSPLRFAPDQRASLTTDAEFNVLMANDIACATLGCSQLDLIGRSALSLLSFPYRDKHRKMLQLRGSAHSEAVLVCGSVVRVQRKDATNFPASLWLKEKSFEGQIVYLWVFEEVKETNVSVLVTHQGGLINATLSFEELYGYHRS